METHEERINKIIKFITELMEKEKYYNWSVASVLTAVKNCATQGITETPEEIHEVNNNDNRANNK